MPHNEAPVIVEQDNSALLAELQSLRAENEALKVNPNSVNLPDFSQIEPKRKKAYQLDEAEDGQVYGEFDVKKQYPFPKGWMGRVVVRQVDVQKMNSGTMAEDLGSQRIMNYEPEVYEALERKGLFDANVKRTILHDPR